MKSMGKNYIFKNNVRSSPQTLLDHGFCNVTENKKNGID